MPIPGLVIPGHALSGGNDAYTKLLLHMNGSDASTTFADSSASAHTVGVVGNAQIDTAQSRFGGASGFFDGSGDYLTLDGSSDFAFGTGDFTVDFWWRTPASVADHAFFDCRPASTNGAYPLIAYENSGSKFLYYVNTAVQISGGSASPNTWYHLAVSRAGGTTRLFVNGTQIGSSYADSTNYLNGGAGRPVIGTLGYLTSLYNLGGWIDEMRVSKGIARWTGSFTPPTEAYF